MCLSREVPDALHHWIFEARVINKRYECDKDGEEKDVSSPPSKARPANDLKRSNSGIRPVSHDLLLAAGIPEPL